MHMAVLFDTIKKDHDGFKSLFSKIIESSSGAVKTRRTSYEKLHRDILAHMEAEEHTLYPALLETDARSMGLAALEEHETAKSKMAEIDQLSEDDEHWIAKFKVLRALVEHHVQDEESTIIPKAKELFSDDQIKSMSREFADIRKGALVRA